MEVEKQESEDSKQPQEALNEWVDLPNGDRQMLVEPKKINDPLCKHEWQWIFTDSEGFDNYRCQHCPFGKRERKDG